MAAVLAGLPLIEISTKLLGSSNFSLSSILWKISETVKRYFEVEIAEGVPLPVARTRWMPQAAGFGNENDVQLLLVESIIVTIYLEAVSVS